MELSELKAAYRIQAAWRDLGLPGEPGESCRSPFPDEHKHGDANPSFSVSDEGRRWKNFANGEGGDVFDLIRKARACNMVEAIRFVKDRLGIPHPERKPDERKAERPKLPPLRAGTAEELRQLVNRRGFGVEALRLAQTRGIFHVTNLWGIPAWCVTDARRALVEFRRLDGEMWPAYGRLTERKSHCMGRGKNWPLGVAEAARFGKIIVCEGAPDFLAAHHFALLENKVESVGIVCVLGASNHTLAPEALAHFKGKRVCLYPHLDRAGETALRAWARQIKDAGAARVTAFDLSGLVLTDGSEGKDLADVCRISADCLEHQRKFAEVLP